MPTHTIKFELPEEQPELDTVLHALDFCLCLTEFSDYLRHLWKRGYWEDNSEVTPEEIIVIDKIKSKFVDILLDRNVADLI